MFVINYALSILFFFILSTYTLQIHLLFKDRNSQRLALNNMSWSRKTLNGIQNQNRKCERTIKLSLIRIEVFFFPLSSSSTQSISKVSICFAQVSSQSLSAVIKSSSWKATTTSWHTLIVAHSLSALVAAIYIFRWSPENNSQTEHLSPIDITLFCQNDSLFIATLLQFQNHRTDERQLVIIRNSWFGVFKCK